MGTYTMTAGADQVTTALLHADQRKNLFEGPPPTNVSHVLVLAAPYNCDEFVVLGRHAEIADLVRRIVGTARSALTGSGTKGIPNLSIPARVISAVLTQSGAVTDEAGAMLLADQIDLGLHDAGLRIVERDQPPTLHQ